MIKLDFWWNIHWNISLDFNFIFFDQNGWNLINLDFWWNNHWNISSDFQLYFFFDEIESDLSKLDQNCISDESLKFIIRFFNLFIFWSDWIRSFQNWSKSIKHKQIEFLMKLSLKYIIRFSTLFFIFFHIQSDLSKMEKIAQTWSDCTSDQSKNC